MKFLLAMTLMAAATACAAPAASTDGGGRDLSVALFSTRTVRAVTLTPIGSSTWTATCSHCTRTPMRAPMKFSAGEIFAGGGLRIRDAASGEEHAATGLWHLRGTPHEGLDIILTLPSERYVAAVLDAEAAAGEPAASLRALAIVARTYALGGTHYVARPGHLPADLCDSTACQAMRLGPVPLAVDTAVRETAGETLWFGAHRAEVFFSQNCGGFTEDAATAWPAIGKLPYLNAHVDPYCARHGPAHWHAEVSLTSFEAIAQEEGWHVPAHIAAVKVVARSSSHRAIRVAFLAAGQPPTFVSATALRFAIDRALGWNTVRSDLYDLALAHGALVFDGRGYGHGVGLCQAGATEMAREGKSTRDILAFYFPGTSLRILPVDSGWQETRIGPVTVRSTATLRAAQAAGIAATWAEAARRFPEPQMPSPTVWLAPSSELFRQLTAQPGWMLASTAGTTIVLQPGDIFARNHVAFTATLLHEMLHTRVEAEAGARAPLWLREGLVEMLAGEAAPAHPAMRANVIDAALLAPGTREASQRAHLAANATVRSLVTRYGMSTVRGWLVSGVPASITP
jgi:stage II sporulation protein D